MTSLLNTERPLIFCPGCAHERIARSLDKAFMLLGLTGQQIALVSDIGCSGLFDTFFNTHAMHGLHGRSITYATGIKMANPEITVITTMGDGGIGIGGAHFLAACRRNLNLTLLILNNFNFGMTGGQFSSTTPPEAQANSGFLNQLEQPMDTCKVARAAGAPYVVRCSGYDKNLAEKIAKAISYDGMSIIDIHGICPGRYTKNNKLTPSIINKNLSKLSAENGEIAENVRPEYRKHYDITSKLNRLPFVPPSINPTFKPLQKERQEIMILGSAGQRIVTAGEILCLAGLTSGLSANQKNDYPITVLRGHSVSDLVLSPHEIEYTGIDNPNVVIAIAEEGIRRRSDLFENLTQKTLIITDTNLKLPENRAKIKTMNFKANGIKSQDMAMACLVIMAEMGKIVTTKMLKKAINIKFKKPICDSAIALVEKIKRILSKQSL